MSLQRDRIALTRALAQLFDAVADLLYEAAFKIYDKTDKMLREAREAERDL